jgi:hypothetical protein
LHISSWSINKHGRHRQFLFLVGLTQDFPTEPLLYVCVLSISRLFYILYYIICMYANVQPYRSVHMDCSVGILLKYYCYSKMYIFVGPSEVLSWKQKKTQIKLDINLLSKTNKYKTNKQKIIKKKKNQYEYGHLYSAKRNRNETKLTKTKRNQRKRNETKRNETKSKKTKRNEINEMKTK